MVKVYNFRCLLSFSFLTFLFSFATVTSAEYSPSFNFKKFDKNSNYFWSQISLSGDAKVVENGSFIQLTRSWNYSSGRITYKQPINLFGGNNPKRRVSFGTYFAFSISPENGDGIAFILRNVSDSQFVVKFDTKLDPNSGDLNDNNSWVNVGSHVSIKVKNASDLKLKLNSSKKLQCWIDFEASSKRVGVRISALGEERPISPLISCPIDLSKMFQNHEVFMSLVSSNLNTTQVSKLYSWSFKLREVPIWLHSQPLDPLGFKKDVEPVAIHKRRDCILKVFIALVFGTGCGILGALIALCAYSVCASTKAVTPLEYAIKPVAFNYDKVKVIVIDKSDNTRH